MPHPNIEPTDTVPATTTSTDMAVPPIPVRLAHRPTIGGLVVPVFSGGPGPAA